MFYKYFPNEFSSYEEYIKYLKEKGFTVDVPILNLLIMTREEEIRHAGIEYTMKNRPICIAGAAFSEIADKLNRNHAFEDGAKWADETIIEKACKWLCNNVYKHVDDRRLSMYFEHTNDVIESFRKAMEK